MKGNKWLTGILLLSTVLWVGFIFTRSLQPAEVSHAESMTVLGWLPPMFRWISLHFVRKAAHFLEFFLLGLLLCLDAGRLGIRRIWLPLGLGLLAALTDETIQRFVPGRSGELADVLLDFVGSTAGCLAAAARKRGDRRRPGKTKKGRKASEEL